jgi:hypothetical protein
MASEFRLRRGTSAQTRQFVGAEGEVTVDTDRRSLVVHDGKTAGGVPIARLADLTASNVRITDERFPSGGTTLEAKLQQGNIVFEDFGALGDGRTDDTQALLSAFRYSQSSGKPVYGLAGKNYLFRATLPLVDQTTGLVAKVRGAGSNCCRLSPTGTFDAVVAHGKSWHGAGHGAARGVEFSGFQIDGARLQGSVLDIRRVGLHSKFEDLKLGGNKGVGLFLQSVFDHVYRDIEVRNCTDVGIYVNETLSSDKEGFQECSFLNFDRVHVLSCNARKVQWICSGGDAYTFISCKPSEGSIGIQFKNRSVGHSLIGTYIDGQTVNLSQPNIGIEVGSECFNISVVGGRFWNVKYAVDFVGGGRSSVSGTNVVYDSPIGPNVADVRLQQGVQQPVSVSAGLAVEDKAGMLRQEGRRIAGDWRPAFLEDEGKAGDFLYAEQSGEFRAEGGLLYVSYVLTWTRRPTAGRGIGLYLPMPIWTGLSHFLIRTAVVSSDAPNLRFLGHFQNNTHVKKLYLYPDAKSILPATADAFPERGTVMGSLILPLR